MLRSARNDGGGGWGGGGGAEIVGYEDGVADFDVLEGSEDGVGGEAAGASEVPLEVADPEDEFGDGGGAGVYFEAEELVGVDGEAFEAGED